MAERIQPTREGSTAVQLATYDNPGCDTGYGEGPMEDALIRFRCKTALKTFQLIRGPFLDLGCGKGEIVSALTEQHKLAVGIDLAPGRLAKILSDYPGCQFVHGLVQELPFASNSIWGITAFEIFEHLIPDDSRLMLFESLRVLRPGGKLVLSTPNTRSISGRLRSLLREDHDPKSGRLDHFNEVNYRELAQLLKVVGFEEIRLFGIGILPGMWRIQKLVPIPLVHNLNILAGRHVPQIASETLAIAQKPF